MRNLLGGLEEDFNDEVYIRVMDIGKSQGANDALSKFVIIFWLIFQNLN